MGRQDLVFSLGHCVPRALSLGQAPLSTGTALGARAEELLLQQAQRCHHDASDDNGHHHSALYRALGCREMLLSQHQAPGLAVSHQALLSALA